MALDAPKADVDPRPVHEASRGRDEASRVNKRPWPAGDRLVLWAVGVALVRTVMVATLFLLNGPR